MPRSARIESSSAIYHVMMRGNNKQTIFWDNDDYQEYLFLAKEKVDQKSCFLYSWCLMSNHIHLLIKEKQESLSMVMMKIQTTFVQWYNKKYNRSGHVFHDRFKSQVVEDPTYFFRVFRYIHRNPLEAGLCKRMEDYPFSSYAYYFRNPRYQAHDVILNLMEKDDLERYHFAKDENMDDFLDINNLCEFTDSKIIKMILDTGLVKELSGIKALPRERQNEMFSLLSRAGIPYQRIRKLIDKQ